MADETRHRECVLLTGATGYVGGRLLQALVQDGINVRCLVRDPKRLHTGPDGRVEVMKGDLLRREDLEAAMQHVAVAYYLVHSMSATSNFAERDRLAARNFATAAKAAGVERIIYLGGLGSGGDLSPHLASRQEVGSILRGSGVKTIEFRASVILGSGSLSFELIRSLVDRLPVMITPRWIRIRAQPIAIEDVVLYLLRALESKTNESEIFEIGGADRVTYGDLMLEYARQRGLRRLMLPVPFLTPRLSSLWLGLVTPIYAKVGRQLIESIRHETIANDARARHAFGVQPMGVKEAIARAIRNEDEDYAQTRWSDALTSVAEPQGWGGQAFGSRFVDSRSLTLPSSPETVFAVIERVGGQTGWYSADWLWRLRGLIDLALGGAFGPVRKSGHVNAEQGQRNSRRCQEGLQ